MNETFTDEKYQLNPERWLNTLPNYRTRDNRSTKKYSLTIILFVMGLILVSVIKNETRSLQKEISNLITSIEVLKLDLYQETLDHDVITSPENISRLAKKYLESNFISYKKSQIKQFGKNEKILTKLEKMQQKKNFGEKRKEIASEVKTKITKKIEKRKTQLRNIQKIYSEPEKIPSEIKIQVVKKFEEKKNQLRRLYTEPKDTIQLGRASRWAVVQIIKAFLGMPIVPGK